jgi:site-specific DNA-methyltransferase (adenine-specific)
MQDIADKSIDMILCDLPYGTTACSWDVIIPFEPLWTQYKRIIKDNGAIVLTASQPFTSKLVMSNLGWFKYELIWDKVQGKQPFLAQIQPMKSHENILIFGKRGITYNPQKRKGEPYIDKRGGQKASTDHYGEFVRRSYQNSGTRMPISIIKYNNPNTSGQHPTQKPVALFEYLIKTYTNESDTVLDNCAGSGTTAIACIKNNRNFILIEKEKKYIEIINQRIKQELSQADMFRTIDYQENL